MTRYVSCKLTLKCCSLIAWGEHVTYQDEMCVPCPKVLGNRGIHTCAYMSVVFEQYNAGLWVPINFTLCMII